MIPLLFSTLKFHDSSRQNPFGRVSCRRLIACFTVCDRVLLLEDAELQTLCVISYVTMVLNKRK